MNGSPYSPLKVFHHPHRLAMLRSGGQPSPTQVQLVISDYCNENCNFCAYRLDGYTSNELFKVIEDGKINNNPKRMIPYGKVVEILDDCVELGIGAVQITGGGEPTVHPDHAHIFADVLNRGLDLALVTNGVVLRDEALDLVPRMTWLRVSVDAGTAATYGRTRGAADSTFDKVWGNIGKMAAVKGNATVGVGFVVTAENWHEVVEATKLARGAGADNIRISAVFQPKDERYFDGFHEQARDACAEAELMAGGRFKVFNNFGDRLDDLTQHAPDYSFCGYQHFSTYIAGDQNVYRCCVTSYNPRGLVGSIKDQRFKELWESQAKRDDYAAFDARGCERCMFNEKNRTIAYATGEPAHVNFV